MTSNIVLPRIVCLGKGSINQLNYVLETLAVKNPMIVTDKVIYDLGYIKPIENNLTNQKLSYGIYTDTIPEPTDTSLEAGIKQARLDNHDSIIAIGGGSVIDSAKAIAIVAKHGGHIRDYKFPYSIEKSGLPVIAIPTTAGTGSEATKATVITDEKHNEKMLCMGLGLVPFAALVDYELTISLPKRATADSGLDALTHALEAYVSRKANPFTDAQALAAISLIAKNLRTAYNEPNNIEARESMLLGSHLAGIAFTNSSVALVHGMSRPIGAHFHVPHGLSNAMLLPTITEFSIPFAQHRYATCSRAMGIATNQDSDEIANDKLIKEVKALNHDLNVPTLKDYGVNKIEYETLLPLMAKQAIDSGSPSNNPRLATVVELVELYRKVYE